MVSLTDKGSTLIVIANDTAWGSENGMLKYCLVAMLSVRFVCFSVLHMYVVGAFRDGGFMGEHRHNRNNAFSQTRVWLWKLKQTHTMQQII